MLLFGVTIPVNVPQSSEILEGLDELPCIIPVGLLSEKFNNKAFYGRFKSRCENQCHFIPRE
jgi:hypothetical protein